MHFVHFNEIQEAKKWEKRAFEKKTKKTASTRRWKTIRKKTHKLNCKKKTTTMIPFAELNIKISKY